MEVVPGIHQLQIPIPDNPLGFINAYLVKTDRGCMLIDTGWNTDEAFGALARQMGEVDVTFSDLCYIAITHAHPDHFGLVGRLKPHTKAMLVIHELERAHLNSRYVHYENLLEEMDQWLRINGVPEADRPRLTRASMAVLGLVSVALPDWTVHGGEHIRVGDFDFELIWTPGHSPGHLCFYERARRIFISGDHVLPRITPNVSMHTQSMGNPLVDYLDSLRAVEDLPVDIVLPSHKEAFRDLRGRAAEIRAHHEQRKQEIVAAFSGEAKTAYQVAASIRWSTKGVPWADLAPWPKRSAVTETLAHLELLRAESVLSKKVKGGIIYYAVAKEREIGR